MNDSKHWSESWQTKKTTSFGDLFPKNYDGTFLKFWQNEITKDLSNIVDLACGNGALSWITHDIISEQNRSATITGVDFAEIDPFAILEKDKADYPHLTFIGNTPIENLPFKDNSVDCFVSQYGFEYADLSKSIPSITRCLRDKGKMAFIMHDIESGVISGAMRGLLPCKIAHDKFQLHDHFIQLSEIIESEKNQNRLQNSKLIPEKSKSIELIIQKIGSVCKNPSESESFFAYLTDINNAFNNPSLGKDDRNKIIIDAKDRNLEYIDRIEDLRAAAIDTERLTQLRDLVEAEGFTITKDELFHYDDHGVFGRAFVAERK